MDISPWEQSLVVEEIMKWDFDWRTIMCWCCQTGPKYSELYQVGNKPQPFCKISNEVKLWKFWIYRNHLWKTDLLTVAAELLCNIWSKSSRVWSIDDFKLCKGSKRKFSDILKPQSSFDIWICFTFVSHSLCFNDAFLGIDRELVNCFSNDSYLY